MTSRTQAYIDTLKKQAELNRLYAEKNQEANLQEKYNITPAPPVEKTAEEEMENSTKQREKALESVRTLPIKPDVTVEFISKLNDEDLVFFNMVFNDFKDTIKNFRSIDANFLGVLFDRYRDKFVKTKGISIPLEMSDIRRVEKDKEMSRIEGDDEKLDKMEELATTKVEKAKVAAMRDQQKRTAKRVAEIDSDRFNSQARFRESFAKRVELPRELIRRSLTKATKDLNKLYEDEAAIRDRISQGRVAVAELEEKIENMNVVSQSDIDVAESEINDLPGSLRTRKEKANRRAVLQKKIKRTKEKRDREVAKFQSQIVAINNDLSSLTASLEMNARLQENLQSDIEEYNRQLDRVVEDRDRYTYNYEKAAPGSAEGPTEDDEDPRFNVGYGLGRNLVPSGLRISRSSLKPGVKGLRGRKPVQHYAPFGRYMIHMPQLQKGFLNVKFKSKAAHPMLPRVEISSQLRDALLHAVEHGSFDYQLVKKVPKKEMKLLIKTCNISNIEHPFVVEDEEAEKERFEVLRGSIEAGNDNPQIVKELKQLLIKFMAEGRIKRRDAIQTLYQLACI